MKLIQSLGFTLVELLVTIFIIALLAGATIPLLAEHRRRGEVRMAAEEIRSTILEAKNYSLAPRQEGANIKFYAIIFYGPNHPDPAYRNSYEIYEDNVPVPGSLRRLPRGVNFRDFNWDNTEGDGTAEIRFLVERQGAIGDDTWASNIGIAQIQISREQTWVIEVIKATGGVSISR